MGTHVLHNFAPFTISASGAEWTAVAAIWPPTFEASATVTQLADGDLLAIVASKLDQGVLTNDAISSVVVEFDWAVTVSDPQGGMTFAMNPGSSDGPHYGSSSGHHTEEIISAYGAPPITRSMFYTLDSDLPHYWQLALMPAYNGTFTPFTLTIAITHFQVTVTDGAADNADEIDLPPPTPPTFLYEVVPVVVAAVEPPAGLPAGGLAVVLTGRGFQTGAAVTFGAIAATAIVVASAERITCSTPAHAAGLVDVVVTNPDSGTGTRVEGFAYRTTPPSWAVAFRTPSGAAAANMRLEGARISHTLGAASRMTFTTAVEPAGEEGAQFYAFGVELFAGTVIRKLERTDGRNRLRCWDTEAIDYTHRLARVRPFGSWTAVSASSILATLVASFAPGFSASGVEDGLPAITLALDGSVDLWAAIVEICQRVGAKAFLDHTTLHVFTASSGITLAAVTPSNPDLQWPDAGQAVSIEYDYASIINRITVRGAAGVTATVDDAASIAAFGTSQVVIDDNTLETASDCAARASQELVGATQPTAIVHYTTRDLLTRVGAMVPIAIDRPAINATFVVQNVEIDQLDLVVVNAPPRFTVTAVPPDLPIRRMRAGDGGQTLIEDVIDLKATEHKQPKLDGAVTSAPGGKTEIPAASIPASKLAGCIPGSHLLDGTVTSTQLAPTGVAAGAYGSGGASLTSYTVDASGRITTAATDPVPVVKTDGSQPWTADQAMGGYRITAAQDPIGAQDVATKQYVDTAIAASGTGVVRGEVPSGTVNGLNTVFTTAAAYTALAVYRNGGRQKRTVDYTETTATTFTFVVAPLTGDLLLVDYGP